MQVVLMGPPGAGKGTQGELLAERLGVPRYATGDVLRRAMREETDLGRRARRYVDAGELVPDDVIVGIVEEALARPEAEGGFVLDGFPRTVSQAEALDAIVEGDGAGLDAVVYLRVSEEELLRRLTGRRICAECGAVTSVSEAPGGECPDCGGGLVQRDDDRPETVRKRLQVYRRRTEPVLAWYERSEVPVHRVDGEGSVREVQERIRERLAS